MTVSKDLFWYGRCSLRIGRSDKWSGFVCLRIVSSEQYFLTKIFVQRKVGVVPRRTPRNDGGTVSTFLTAFKALCIMHNLTGESSDF